MGMIGRLEKADRQYRALMDLKDEAMRRGDLDLMRAIRDARRAFEASAPAGWSPTDVRCLPLKVMEEA